MSNYLAIDLGASSYRMIVSDGTSLQEIARFDDHLVDIDGVKWWDITTVYNHIIDCLEQLENDQVEITSMSINSWGCDFAPILNLYHFKEDGRLTDQVYGNCYINGPTKNQEQRVNKAFSDEQLFALTAINKQPFNTIYRLPEINSRITFIASYLEMLLTGEVMVDPSIASTTQILDSKTNQYSKTILEKLGIDQQYLPPIRSERYRTANVIHSKYQHIRVVSGTGHDTSYAFYRYSPTTAIINIGSWVICGLNVDQPCVYSDDFNYERGLRAKYKVVNNTIGMNAFNYLLAEHQVDLDYDQVSEILLELNNYQNVDTSALDISRKISEQLPYSDSWSQQIAIYLNSLAHLIASTIEKLQVISDLELEQLVIIGGGSKNKYLIKRLTEEIAGKYKINYGESEATVLGNIQFQMEVDNGSIK